MPVLNERAVRASAGILFFFAMIAFMNAWLVGNFQPTRVFVVVFLTDFGIRLFINPLWAPQPDRGAVGGRAATTRVGGCTAEALCLGCKLYNAFNTDKAQLCPGGVCEAPN